jgi:transcriptional regulator with XRE-family HTH domain
METVRFGRQVRALRHRKSWRQEDLAKAAKLSRSAIARVEQGRAEHLTVATLDRIATALGARVVCRLDWNGEALDRLVDADHASIVEQVVRILKADGWQCATEVSFSIFGERGSIDVLAFHPVTRLILVVEVKSVVPDIQLTLVTLDRKSRLALQIARERGWEAAAVARLLVVREGRTARRRIDAHAATFWAAFPDRSHAVRRWLAAPDPRRPLAGLWFLSAGTQAVARHRVRVVSGPPSVDPGRQPGIRHPGDRATERA